MQVLKLLAECLLLGFGLIVQSLFESRLRIALLLSLRLGQIRCLFPAASKLLPHGLFCSTHLFLQGLKLRRGHGIPSFLHFTSKPQYEKARQKRKNKGDSNERKKHKMENQWR